MGIIKRQGIKNSIVNYVGVLIGAVSSIFIYPLIPLTDLGMVRFAIDVPVLLASFAGFASSLTAIQYFPIFRNEDKNHNGFLFFLTTLTFIASLIFISVVYIFKNQVSHVFGDEKQYFLSLLPYLLSFTVVVALVNLYQAFAMNFNRIVVPAILHNLLLKIAQPALVLLFAFGFISFAGVFKGLALTLAVMLVGLVAYIGFLGQLKLKPDFRIINADIFKKMMGYSAFNVLVSLGGIITQKMDALLVAPMLGFGSSAVFAFGGFIGEAIDIPRKALAGIAAPLISESIKTGNTAHVEEIYKKSALLQMIAGVFLLVGVWVCADALFDLMPKNGDAFKEGKYVILFLGLARVVDMATGTNAEIITYSEHYRFNFTSFIVLAFLNLILNLILIPRIGINGSALATLISITLINIWRLFYIKQKMHIQPLATSMIGVALFGFVAFLAGFYTPSVKMPFLTILLKGSVVTLVYAFLIIKFKISEDLNHTFYQFLHKIRLLK